MYGASDVRIENVPDATILERTDAVVRVTRACICGSDLWPYNEMEPSETGRVMGHEAIGVVDSVGADVRTSKVGDLVVMPFAFSDGMCEFCHENLPTSCIHGGFFGTFEVAGGGPAPVRAYIEELLPDVLEGRTNRGGCSTASARSTRCPTATAR